MKHPLKTLLSQKKIQKHTIPSNISYGTAIYRRGGVKFILLNDTTAEAWVGGLDGTLKEGAGQRRRTKLYITADKNLAWHCAGNPKDHDIFCKHCVALALAIINTK